MEDAPRHAGHDQGLRDADQALALLAEEAAEGDGAREGGKVDEDGGRQALGVESVDEVRQEPRSSTLDVVDHASEEVGRPDHRIVGVLGLVINRLGLLGLLGDSLLFRFFGLAVLLDGGQSLLFSPPHILDLANTQQVLAIKVSRRQDNRLVQEIVDGIEQVVAVVNSIANIMETL